MNPPMPPIVEVLNAADVAELQQLAALLRDVKHEVAAEWSQQLVNASTDLPETGVNIEQLTLVNEAFLSLVLLQIEQRDLHGLYMAYYESTRRMLEADLLRAPSRPISLVGLYTSARISLRVIEDRLGSTNARLTAAYAKLMAQLMMLVGQAYSDTREAYLQRSFEQINTVSHELRTPLAHLFNYLEMLRSGDFGAVSPEQEGVLGQLIHEADDLLLLLTGMLDLSRLDTGRVSMRAEAFDLPSMLEELVALTPHDHVPVRCEVADGVPALRSDRVKVKQIVGNLLRNAIHHGGGAPVLVRATRAQSDHVEISVGDQGPGIRPEELQVIFEFLERGDAGGLARDGYGIGLHVVRRLVSLLGGTIHVESAPEQGACFRVILPVHAPAVIDEAS